MHIDVHFLPITLTNEKLHGCVAIMVDLLRASTTMTTALAAGAETIVPCESVDHAREVAAKLSSETAVILGGERKGVKIEGFDFGNSPSDYTAKNVSGKTIVFTTTNGTKALAKSKSADRIVVGSFVNLAAVSLFAVDSGRSIQIACAGTDGQVTREDVLCAGAIANACTESYNTIGQSLERTDAARIAIDCYRMVAGQLHEAVCDSIGGRNLQRLGFEADIETVCEVDRVPVVPEYDPNMGRVSVV
ncbi:2-phosphosulfolactate phosphatase [Thalassoroseus pseudoceratinae]|uniref:2-phosphosulfolactate phosphatase n=1 Tax=Thalassoroseus pseudoceratinae TaxID=2713176 RepID=UPI00141DE9C4|nr:2-phosphosulfolactate phosphatase [Thalassoroseus pseudoceratinae]